MAQFSELATATDEDLAGQVRRREYPAFVALFDRYRQRVVSFTARMIGDPDEAENVAHDAFLRMVTDAQRSEPPKPFRTWMFKIAREIAFEFVSENRPEGKASLERLASAGAPPESSGDARHTFTALNALGPVYREVLYLRLFEKMTHEEIGDVTGEKPATVASRLNYAVEHLRKEIR